MSSGERVTWENVLAQGRETLRQAGVREYELDAWYLFEQAFEISRARYYLCARETAAVREEQVRRYREELSRRAAHEPLQHILGTQEFMGLEFLVNLSLIHI